MPRLGFEITIPVFERANTVHTLDGEATVIGICDFHENECLSLCYLCCSTV
jgi:hypothetical protein